LEYIIDCVSFEGKHVLSGIWVYSKTKDPVTNSIIPEYARLIESRGEVQDTLLKYVFECLDALSFKFGPSHSEVIMCGDGPCLVETGARLHGLKGPKMTELATGIGTHELVVDVALNGGRLFNELHAHNYRYVVKKWVFNSHLLNRHKEGILSSSVDIPQLRQLPSTIDVVPCVQPGEDLKITRDLATAAGIVLQAHSSLQQCLDDISVIRELEETVLFQVLPARPSLPSIDMSKQEQVSSPMRVANHSSPYMVSPIELPPATIQVNESGNPQCDELCLVDMQDGA